MRKARGCVGAGCDNDNNNGGDGGDRDGEDAVALEGTPESIGICAGDPGTAPHVARAAFFGCGVGVWIEADVGQEAAVGGEGNAFRGCGRDVMDERPAAAGDGGQGRRPFLQRGRGAVAGVAGPGLRQGLPQRTRRRL